MEISYKTQDGCMEVKLVYIVKHRYHYYRGLGKSWPKHTQCLMFINGLLIEFGEVVKHQKDPDNQAFAYKEATRKVMKRLHSPDIRKILWDKLFNEITD